MEARAVGGRAALLLWSALCACDITPTPSPVEPEPGPEPEPELVAAPESVLEPESAPAPSRVVLVTIDGVRWEDVFEGARDEHAPGSEPSMPNLLRLVRERGSALGGPGCEHDMRASGPNFVSLPGYLEIFTGHSTACTHNGCAPVDTPTFVDEAREAFEQDGDVAVFASWGRLAAAAARDRKAIVLSAGAHAIAIGQAREDAKLRTWLEAGSIHAGYPGAGDYRPDVHTARIALRYLETQRPRLLVVGLGDADEYAHRGDVAGYRRAVHRADDFLVELDRTLARMGEVGSETAVVVTTDHGRARSLRGHGVTYPESQRVFVAAFGAGIARRGVTCAAEPLRLAHVAGAMRALLGLGSEPTTERGPLADAIAPRGGQR